MKKTYIAPVSEEIRLEMATMIATSLRQGTGSAHTNNGEYDKSLAPGYYYDDEEDEEEEW